jgi:hypothetical protein
MFCSPRIDLLESRELLSSYVPGTSLVAAGQLASHASEAFSYMYAPSFMKDVTDGMYKLWTGFHNPATPLGDNIGFKEASSVATLVNVPTAIALSPSGDPSKFDQIHACDPCVYRDPSNGIYYLAYDGNTNGSDLAVATRIGIARSTDGGHTFAALYNGPAANGCAIISPGANFAGGYGVGQPAVVRTNDGSWYMLYTDSPGGANPEVYQVIRSSDPTFGSYTAVTTLPKSLTQAASLDLAYDPIKGGFIVVGNATSVYSPIGSSAVRLGYFDSQWNYAGQQVLQATDLGFSFGEGIGMLKDCTGNMLNPQVFTFASGTIDIGARVSNIGSWWVGGDLCYCTISLTHDNPFCGFWQDVASGDFTGSGKQDLLGRAPGGQWWVGVNNGSTFVNRLWTTWNPNVTWVDVQTGDFNGDGKTDIVSRVLQNGTWWVGLSTGSSFVNSLWTIWNPFVTWVDVRVGDFNGDGKMDIAGRVLETGQWWVAESTGSGFSNSLWTTWNPNVTWVDVRMGDFNGDGKMDIAGRVLETGQWWVAESTGTGFTNSLWTTWNPNVTWVDVRVGDFNGDGKTDIAGRFLQTGQWWVALSTGTSFLNSLWTTWNPYVTWVDVRVGDFNGDGKTDIIGRCLEGGQWWIGLSTGSTFSNCLWGTWSPAVTWVDVQVGDFTGNGSLDLVGRLFENGQWWGGLSNGSCLTNHLLTIWAPF